jgi:hypothetical protein
VGQRRERRPRGLRSVIGAPKFAAAATTATAGKDARLSPEDQSAEKDSDAAIRVLHRPLADPPCMKRFSRLTPTYAPPRFLFLTSMQARQ